jgi:aldehyde dehydrogenase (NAD+)
MKSSSVASVAKSIFPRLGLSAKAINAGVFGGVWGGGGEVLEKCSPIDGSRLGRVKQATPEDYERTVGAAQQAFLAWREVPAPKRGEVVRQLGQALRERKSELGQLVSLETGKILAEGGGEVQEMIDICDFATGLSRQLHGLTIASERPGHRMMEQWHPLGIVGIISAFNFPVAVWSWNSALAAVCGDATIWKPSEKTPLSAIACIRIAEKVCRANGVDPAIFSLVIGDGPSVGELLSHDRGIALVSATGSTRMGRRVGEVVAQRFGRSLLELGGNNAIVVTPSADRKLAQRGILFGAVGTAGQRCTSTRRIIVQESIKDDFVDSLVATYRRLARRAVDRRGGGAGHDEHPRRTEEERRPGALWRRTAGGKGFSRRALRLALRRRGEERVAGGAARDFRPDPLRHGLPSARGGRRAAEWRAAGVELGDLHDGPARGGAIPVGRRQRLRPRECQPRHQRRGDRRGVRWREGDRWRP